MKVQTIDIMLRGNPQHEHFGIFAKFITGMGKEINLPNPPISLCDVCFRPKFDVGDDNSIPALKICLYCRGRKDALEELKPKSFNELVVNHEHDFKNVGSKSCKICGLFKGSYQLMVDAVQKQC